MGWGSLRHYFSATQLSKAGQVLFTQLGPFSAASFDLQIY